MKNKPRTENQTKEEENVKSRIKTDNYENGLEVTLVGMKSSGVCSAFGKKTGEKTKKCNSFFFKLYSEKVQA